MTAKSSFAMSLTCTLSLSNDLPGQHLPFTSIYSVCSEGLAFTIDLHVPPKPAAPPPMLAPAPPASPTKKTGFRSVFSSPKKKVAPPPVRAAAPQALPDPFYDYVDRDGKLASAHFVFAEEASKCKLRKHRFNVPFTNTGAKRACKGAMSIDMLYVPATPSIPRDGLPKSMDEALAGMEAAERSSKVIHEGVLTQLGGDCSVSFLVSAILLLGLLNESLPA